MGLDDLGVDKMGRRRSGMTQFVRICVGYRICLEMLLTIEVGICSKIQVNCCMRDKKT